MIRRALAISFVRDRRGATIIEFAIVAPVLGLLIQPLVDSTYKEGAGFLDLTYHFNSQFDIQAGGRWSSNSQTATQITTYDSTLAALLGVNPNP